MSQTESQVPEATAEEMERERQLALGSTNALFLSKMEKLILQRIEGNARVAIRMSEKIVFLNVCDIIYCEALGGYTKLHVNGGERLLSSKALGDFERELQQHSFYRIHHSVLINLNCIKEFQRQDGAAVVMRDNTRLEVSSRRLKSFLNVIEATTKHI